MSTLATPPLALYVHFPWCVRKCPYCDFNSYTLSSALPQAPYVARLERDIEAQAPQVEGREVGSVFFGGGTPSLFSPAALARVLEATRRQLHLAPDAEVTLEANPGAIERRLDLPLVAALAGLSRRTPVRFADNEHPHSIAFRARLGHI